MTIRDRRVALLAAMLLTAAALALLGGVRAARAAAGPLLATAPQPALPKGAALGAAESATFSSISCTAPGDCGAGGSYRASAGGQLAMLDAEVNGVWGASQGVGLPGGAATAARNARATINSVSCAAANECVAVGAYRGSGNGALVVTQAGGTWSSATLPSVSGEATGGGVLDSVSCPSDGNCVAVGTSATTAGLEEPTIVTETNGTWSAPTLPALPAGDLRTAPTWLSVSCPALGECVVAGTDYPAAGPQLPMVIVQSGGRWQPAAALAAPSGTVADGGQSVSLGAIDCPAVGRCTAVGDAATAGGATGFALVDSGGSFSEVGLPYPAGAAGFLPDAPALGLAAVACADPGDCAAAGAYPTAGTPAQPRTAAMAAVANGGVWRVPVSLAAPGDAAPAASGAAGVRALSCPVPGTCEGVGGYVTAGGAEIPMVVRSVPVLAVTSASLPVALLGRPYSAQLGVTGGAGPATWTVSAGALPVGLMLNPTTGVISGTPRFPEASAFTITVSDSGPPAQSAGAGLSIRVVVQGPPAPRLTHLRVIPRRVSAAGRRVRGRCMAITRRNRRHRHCLRAVRLTLRAQLSIAATVRLTAVRVLRGRWVRHGLLARCRAPRRGNRHQRRCLRTLRVPGHDTRQLRAGTHTIRWRAAVGGHALGPGRYRLRLVPSFGRWTGRTATVRVWITG